MKKIVKRIFLGLALTIAIGFGIAAPALADWQGTYGTTIYYSNTHLATGDHDGYYGHGTVSVDSGCVAGGIFWFEIAGGGRCTNMVSVEPRLTRTLTFTTNFTGGAQVWGTASGTAPYYISGRYRFNVV